MRITTETAARNSLSGKKVVVTGAAGYIGSALVERLAEVPCKLTRVLRTPSAISKAPQAEMDDVIGDVRDPALWSRIVDHAEVIWHLAAQTNNLVAEADPGADFQQNVLPMLNLLEACRKASCRPRIVFASTVTIVGITDRIPVDESFPDSPPTIYDLHKKMAEDYLKYYCRLGRASGISLRMPNVYGPSGSREKSGRGILNQMVAKAVAGEPLTVYGAGDQIRDYTFIDDIVDALLAALCLEEIKGEHFVIGTGEGHTIADAVRCVADCVSAKTGRRVEVRHIAPPSTLPGIDTRNFIARPNQFREASGWRAHVAISEGVSRCVGAAIRSKTRNVVADHVRR